MDSAAEETGSLRERKRRRAREAIVEAAYELFTEHGFDRVTVTDIAERAEVGRATFFRYFGDKQEVLFGGDDDMRTVIADAGGLTGAGAGSGADSDVPPIGDSLPAALAVARKAVLAFIDWLVSEPEKYVIHERLVASRPELTARGLMKQRAYVPAMTDILTERGADAQTANLAAEMSLACFYAGRAAVDNDPRRLRAGVAAAFDRVQS